MKETVLQFGAGRFLRGFIDRFISELNAGATPLGAVVVVQSTPGERARRLRDAGGRYPVVVRGVAAGETVEEVQWVDCISRAVTATEQWEEVVRLASAPQLRWIVSNATEAGYVCSETPPESGVPETLPGKLTAVLEARFRAGAPPVGILPCELIANNADRLRELVLEQAGRWGYCDDFRRYAAESCVWLNNLVDCIVSDLPSDHPLGREHPLALTAEPYALLAIERPANGSELPWASHRSVRVVDSLRPYYLRKVRILNGLHTAMVARFTGSALETVQQVVHDAEGLRWTRDLLYGEIVPTLIGRVADPVAFADATLERFANPFLKHNLSDIRLNHEEKVPVRLQPTAEDFERLYGVRPPLLQAAIDRNLGSV